MIFQIIEGLAALTVGAIVGAILAAVILFLVLKD